MAVFDAKIFNPTVFQKYVQRVPNLNKNELVKNGVLQNVNTYKSKMVDQDGGNYIIEPIKGLLDGDVLNYDGETDIEATSRKTFMQGKVAFGRAKAWVEKDFSQELTGIDWIKTVAGEVAEYYQGIDQDDLLAILKGIFGMTDTGKGSVDFKENHIYDVSGSADGVFGATTLNTAMQKAVGDNKNIFQLAFMHSMVATNLENLQLIQYLKYTDASGITRDLGLATLNGRLVIIDDGLPTEEVEEDDVKYTKYTTYVLGKGAFEFEDVGVRVASEMSRDPKTNGGQDTLYTRQRHIIVPKWISFTKAQMAKNSPTNAELGNGANWEVVNSGETAKAQRNYVNHKAIPMLKIVTRG